MLHGDISNRQAPIIAFNVDNLLFNEDSASKGALHNFLSKFKTEKSKLLSKGVDTKFLSILSNIWNSYDYSIYLVTFHEENDYEEFLIDILDKNMATYTSIIKFSNWEDLREISNLQYAYYFDNDEELISYVGAGALHINEIVNIIKTGGR
jgi:hypothetical protein